MRTPDYEAEYKVDAEITVDGDFILINGATVFDGPPASGPALDWYMAMMLERDEDAREEVYDRVPLGSEED